MYGRAPRALAHAGGGSTTSKIGPGSYSPQEPKHRADGFAPFSSLATRETFLDISDNVAMAPGPGYYDPKPSKARQAVTGTGNMNSRTRRFPAPSFITPGPGAYNVTQPVDNPVVTLQAPNVEPSVAPSPYFRITYARQSTAPSIPIPGKSYGYEETDTGGLVPQAPPDKDSSIGPAYYNVYHDETEATRRYKGVHFGNLKEKRAEFTGTDGPGPADYDPKNTASPPAVRKPSPPASSFSSKVPRYHETVSKSAKNKNIPGPGHYEFQSQFRAESDPNEFAPFGSTTMRFYDSDTLAPPPGAYDDPRSALEVTKRLSGMKKSPFGQTSVRFKLNKQALQTPGPGMYNDMAATSLAVQLSKKAILESSKKGGFGTVCSRTVPLIAKNTVDLPGPAHYNPSSDCKSVVSWVPESCTANFASKTKRLHEPPPIVTDIPPPGSYEVQNSYSKTQGKLNVNSSKHGPFLSSSSRTAPPRDILLKKPDPNIPGPDRYRVEKVDTKTNNTGLICSREPRFKGIPNQTPGPAAYTVSEHTLSYSSIPYYPIVKCST